MRTAKSIEKRLFKTHFVELIIKETKAVVCVREKDRTFSLYFENGTGNVVIRIMKKGLGIVPKPATSLQASRYLDAEIVNGPLLSF